MVSKRMNKLKAKSITSMISNTVGCIGMTIIATMPTTMAEIRISVKVERRLIDSKNDLDRDMIITPL